MAARLAAPAQNTNTGGVSADDNAVLIAIPELPGSINLHHAIQQVNNVVEVNGDSSERSSPNATEPQHTYITVAKAGHKKIIVAQPVIKKEFETDDESEGNSINYQVQYVEPQEIYGADPQPHIETLRSYPVYSVGGGAVEGEGAWAEDFSFVVEEERSPSVANNATPTRMPPATVQWLLDHYETADGVSLPRSTLYAHYLRHCNTHNLDPVNAASFGKLIRSVFVGLRTRRLGTRGNSKYHYYGIRAKPNSGASPLSDPVEDKSELSNSQDARERDSDENSPIGGASAANKQYLGNVTAPDPPPLSLINMPDDITARSLMALRKHHRDYGSEFLEAVASLDTTSIERTRRSFWRRPNRDLPRKELYRLCRNKDVAKWLRVAELNLHQRAVELLLPDVLRPQPPHLTQAIRNFAKGSEGVWRGLGRAQRNAGRALAAALRRYTSLNHLAQAARAVLANRHQIHQMLSDLNRVDFKVVREQAAWACSCGSADTANRLEADFKATLGRGASLEQWASWLDECVRTALSAHENKPDYGSRARRLLLDWSFYSSLVIRELTLRSAASFGSFHLIRLLYDEYVAYLIERRVAEHEQVPPIAVMHQDEEEDENEEAEEDRMDIDEDDQDWWDDEEDDDDSGPETKKKII